MAIANPADAQHRTAAPTAYSAEGAEGADVSRVRSRAGNETKASFKTSEFAVFVAAVVGVLLASYLVKATDGHADYFMADRAWFYVVLLSIGYMVSRGLAKSGIRHRNDV
ncbi:hypothetical protein MRAB57_4210 [Mycobacterium rhizamassiliense]|uniref:Uncharacterized protein n=1 Tax=Mycobacterium rhizamassiliense TaxID=1841860 RepID=A0A2U3NXY2_9MYCO|nr:hypothetical protein [Mycobacterium rhizamassiliense]SPM36369.1 hypothetical protein MRAB57_4210 [Mycobacterium rhizamassiliense]